MSARKRVLVGISGGVDSAVAAALLKTQGFDVIGAYISVWPEVYRNIPMKGASCSLLTGPTAARKICEHLEIPFYPVDASELFHAEVLDPMVNELLSGRVTNPCVLCAQKVKIIMLLAQAQKLKCDFIATGHYAKVIQNPESTDYSLFQAVDGVEDQSFYLFGLKQEHFAKILVPLGDILKSKVKKMAITFELPVDEKKPTCDVCLTKNGGAEAIVVASSPERYRPGGPLVTVDGTVIGRHTGIFKHPIGTREGLVIGGKMEYQKYCVIGYDLAVNGLILGPEESLSRHAFVANNCNWIGQHEFYKGIRARAKLGPRHQAADCIVTLLNMNSVRVDFDQPQTEIFPGNPVVFLQEDLVIGGGWIDGFVESVGTKLKPRSSTGYN